jgi:hypothetical protein
MMPPKMLTRMPFDGGIGEDDAEGFGDGFFAGAAADIEEVGGFAAVELDDVHGGHGEAGAVDEAADVAIEGDVGEAQAVARISAGFSSAGSKSCWMSLWRKSGVVVEVELGVDGEDLAVRGCLLLRGW